VTETGPLLHTGEVPGEEELSLIDAYPADSLHSRLCAGIAACGQDYPDIRPQRRPLAD
jgi:hypothetical protein